MRLHTAAHRIFNQLLTRVFISSFLFTFPLGVVSQTDHKQHYFGIDAQRHLSLGFDKDVTIGFHYTYMKSTQHWFAQGGIRIHGGSLEQSSFELNGYSLEYDSDITPLLFVGVGRRFFLDEDGVWSFNLAGDLGYAWMKGRVEEIKLTGYNAIAESHVLRANVLVPTVTLGFQCLEEIGLRAFIGVSFVDLGKPVYDDYVNRGGQSMINEPISLFAGLGMLF